MANIYQRGRIWWARAQRKGVEHRTSLETASRGIAERRFRDWIVELEAIAWGDKPRRTFQDASELFIREHLTTIKPSAARRYGVSLKHLASHFGAMMLDKIKGAELAGFESRRRSEGVSSGTIRRDFACLSSLFATTEEREWIEDGSNPVPSYLRRRAKRGLKEAPPRTRYLTADEEAKLLQEATPAVRDAIALSIDTGLRRGELFGLTWRQVDLTRGTIATTTRTKSGRARMVPIPERSAQILAHLPRRLDVAFVLVNPDTETRYVQMNKGLGGARRRAMLEDLRWHDLRRTAGCRWLQRDGKSMEEVSILLGHSSVVVTEARYAFLEGEAVAESLSGRTKTGTGTADAA